MSTILAQARLRACRHWPFASHAILSMVPVPRPGLGTLSVDQHWRLYHEEAALEQMGPEQAAGLILHELDHLLKRHHKRGEQLVAGNAARWDTWNHATDASINAGLRSEGIPLPPGPVYPEQFGLPDGMSAEEYFRSLLDQQQKDDPQPEPERDEPDGGDGGHDQPQPSADEPAPLPVKMGKIRANLPRTLLTTILKGKAATNARMAQIAQGTLQTRLERLPATWTTAKTAKLAMATPALATDRVNRWLTTMATGPASPGEPQSGQGGSCSDGRQLPWELGPPDRNAAT